MVKCSGSFNVIQKMINIQMYDFLKKDKIWPFDFKALILLLYKKIVLIKTMAAPHLNFGK